MVGETPGPLRLFIADVSAVVESGCSLNAALIPVLLVLIIWIVLGCCLIHICVQDMSTRLISRRSLVSCTLCCVGLVIVQAFRSSYSSVDIDHVLQTMQLDTASLLTSFLWSMLATGYLAGVRTVAGCAMRLQVRFATALNSSQSTKTSQSFCARKLLGGGDIWLVGSVALLVQSWVVVLIFFAAFFALIVQGVRSFVVAHIRRTTLQMEHKTSRFFEPFAFAPYIVAAFLLVMGVVLVV